MGKSALKELEYNHPWIMIQLLFFFDIQGMMCYIEYIKRSGRPHGGCFQVFGYLTPYRSRLSCVQTG